ncbi:hypothetical protein [Propionispira raffinosivorans]|uniref:hypothetical protein n=1 Tax=Propionispira raffinosivorans TaxID=86959 RepID=UPI000360796B|nr:hypothetical protein [Propionispira raffinosivorans]
MERIQIFNHDISSIGLYKRNSTEGAELNLVNDFIDYYSDNFLKKGNRYNLAVFIEPRILSGFPDIVFAVYNPNIVDMWSEARKTLNLYDLKILFQIVHSKGMSGANLIDMLKFPEKQIITSIEKLYDSKLIYRRGYSWRAKEIKQIYSIKDLISVEAKIGDIKKVAKQSFINTWFASQSYALTNSNSPQKNTIENFSKIGIGLYCKKRNFKKIVPAQKLSSPVSYLSLQFNEWIGNYYS